MRKEILSIGMFFLMLSSTVLFPQANKAKKEPSDKDKLTFKLPVGVVVVSARVTDKEGSPVTDLTEKDFRVYEDGKLQSVQTLALETYTSIQPGKAVPQKAAPMAAVPAEPNFTRPRLISVMIDDLASTPEDRFIRVSKAVAKFVDSDMGSGDQMEIVSASGRVQYPFSNDKQLLLEVIASLPQKLNWSPVTRSDCPVLTDLQAQMIYNGRGESPTIGISVPNPSAQSLEEILIRLSVTTSTVETLSCMKLDPSKLENYKVAESHAHQAAAMQYQETMYRNRTLLRTLQQHLRSLRHFDAAKSAILFSDGFLREDIAYELQEVVEQALRSGVVLNTIDVRGLYTDPILPSPKDSMAQTFQYDPNSASITMAAIGTYQFKQEAYTQDASMQADPLSQMASETGGVFIQNNNDFYRGIREIANRQDCFYVLTYTIPPQKPDGRYHSIKVEVNRPGLKVSYRKGYYAPKEEMTFERRKKEDILEALRAPGNLNEIPMGLSYNYYQDDDTTYVVSLLMNVNIRGLRFLEEDSRHKNLISLVVVAFDEADHYISGLEKSVDFRLTEGNYAGLLDRGIVSKVDFKLTYGRYKIKAVVREAYQGKMGSLTKAIEIP